MKISPDRLSKGGLNWWGINRKDLNEILLISVQGFRLYFFGSTTLEGH